MVRDELIAALQRSPFRPFQLSLSDGQQYPIDCPEQVLVTLQSVVIGVARELPPAGSYPALDFHVVADLFHVTRLTEAAGPSDESPDHDDGPPGSNGHPSGEPPA